MPEARTRSEKDPPRYKLRRKPVSEKVHRLQHHVEDRSEKRFRKGLFQIDEQLGLWQNNGKCSKALLGPNRQRTRDKEA